MFVSVVLAAGKGTRMRSHLPKALQPLLGEPLVAHALEAVGALRPDLEVVVVGHGRDEVVRALSGGVPEPTPESAAAPRGRPPLFATQEPQLGTAHAAMCGIEAALRALGAAPETVDALVVNGDLPLLRRETLGRLLATHRETGADATVLTCLKSDPTGYGRIVHGPDGSLRDIVEEPDADPETRKIREINVGVYAFRAAAFLSGYSRLERANVQGEFYLTDVPVKIARGGGKVSLAPVEDEEEIAQVNTRADLARATLILRERTIAELLEAGVTVVDPSTTYVERRVSAGADTVIYPFTVIEHDVAMGAGCEIGPFAHLRPGTRLGDGVSIGNFVELKNSALGPGTKVRHLSYLGDGIVGANVNVGAGTIFANYDGEKKNRTVVEDDASLGSGTILVAPVTVGRGARTGAGAVVLKNRDVPPGAVVAGVPAVPIRSQRTKRNR